MGAKGRTLAGVIGALLSLLAAAQAEEVLVATAANFKVPLEALAEAFEDQRGHDVRIVSGSTGVLYAQIVNGAPYDLFLAADQERPALLARSGLGEADTLFNYAMGRLVLWSADNALLAGDGAEVLRQGAFRRLAIANPELAPYGAAAMEVIQALGLESALSPKLVRGENIGQAMSLVRSRNAELGLVAYSAVRMLPEGTEGSFWLIPTNYICRSGRTAFCSRAALITT